MWQHNKPWKPRGEFPSNQHVGKELVESDEEWVINTSIILYLTSLQTLRGPVHRTGQVRASTQHFY